MDSISESSAAESGPPTGTLASNCNAITKIITGTLNNIATSALIRSRSNVDRDFAIECLFKGAKRTKISWMMPILSKKC